MDAKGTYQSSAAEGAKEDYVILALRQLPKLGAQDWCGWRYEHIAALTKEQARWLVNMILNEKPAPEVHWLHVDNCEGPSV